jgi:hypothetical protein
MRISYRCNIFVSNWTFRASLSRAMISGFPSAQIGLTDETAHNF